MYDKFLDKSLNSTRQTIDDTFIAKYANAVSEQIIELWKEVGLGTFCDGLFRIINPDKYKTIVDDSYPLYEYETATPFMTTVFGDIFAYVKNHVIGDYVVFINIRYGTFKILSENIDILLNIVIFNKSCLENWFLLNEYNTIKEVKAMPKIDECYGYVPALVAGGKDCIDNIQIVKIAPYIDTVIQLMGDLKRIR